MARTLRGCGLFLFALLLLTACGTQTSAGTTPSPSPSGSPTTIPTISGSPTTAAGSTCQPNQLSLTTGMPNAGAGSVQMVFIFTNTSQTSCTLYGYPGMQMLSGGASIPTNVVRTPGTEQTVTLASGGTASFVAQWHDQTGFTTPCASSQQVEVTPPNDFSQLTITKSIQACPDGTIHVTAVTSGSTGGQ